MIGSLDDAKREKRDLIEQFRSASDPLADVLEGCRKGNRCRSFQCPVCEYRKERSIRRQLRASNPKSVIGKLHSRLFIEGIHIHPKLNRRRVEKSKVRLIAHSMNEIGQQTPITVIELKKRTFLVTGLHRLEAAKFLGWDSIVCCYLIGDIDDAQKWMISENVHRADLRVLDRAEYIENWRALVQEKTKEGQDAPPGGHQPEESGLNKTAKELGFTREEVRRAKAIANISPEAKAEARKQRLDNNQRALLEISTLSSAKLQLKVVEELVARKHANRSKGLSVAEQTAIAEVADLKDSISKTKTTIERMTGKLAAERKLLRQLKNGVVTDHPEPTTADCPPIAPDDELTVTSATVTVRPGSGHHALDGDQPGAPNLRALSEEDQRCLRMLQQCWDEASMAVRQAFLDFTIKSSNTGVPVSDNASD